MHCSLLSAPVTACCLQTASPSSYNEKEILTERYWHPAFLLKTKTPSALFSSSGEDGGDWRTNNTQAQHHSILQHNHMMNRQTCCWPAAVDCRLPLSCGSRTVWCRPCWQWKYQAVDRDVSVEETVRLAWCSSSLVWSGRSEARLWQKPASSASETQNEADNKLKKRNPESEEQEHKMCGEMRRL